MILNALRLTLQGQVERQVTNIQKWTSGWLRYQLHISVMGHQRS